MEEKDYKKLYEETVALAKDGLKDGLYLSQSAKAVTEFLFPQLNETEDEKVKRELTRFLIDFNNGYYSRPSENEIDSWIKWIDKKCEQKPTDKAEPKFKVGDWITNGGLLVGQVTSFDGEYYHYMCEGIEQPLHISNASYNWHLWTIQDAKYGDVLQANKCTLIFDSLTKDVDGNTAISSWYFCDSKKFYGMGTSKPDLWDIEKITPATKEQCDILFQKMKEAGYEWDAEKKELKKIEPNPAWSEEDEKFLNYAISLTDDAQIKNFLKSLKERVQPQLNQEWSEYDKIQLSEAIQMIEANGTWIRSEDAVKKVSNWLRYLKPHWRPSEEQMQALFEAKLASIKNREYFLGLLYEDLKKL